ncbi:MULTISPECIES: extracellular solute-binding protein [Paenarthrobacter]|uniref:ABC transporter substrate-binding protein n=1 Tax=Paenarthrobacter TaxID=1742992 RepID=UPI00074D310E|nr:extracellular solute-binding protein [Paenarthrobacter ureafaciens]AMB41343.1 ABC transporter substrate-binding protein [Arthrobacter sp. ATCC 21022]KUR64203.1 ABC transporter substrate-binding protein [Arthrobacter sp. ATCC 21022]RWW94017.1 extracellular solute-binding protein [Paenarthrobacter ureafaciens]BCW85263.1 sugar ABC transporter substrate-binding protein [Arthrobacter sp. NicSoilE8]
MTLLTRRQLLGTGLGAAAMGLMAGCATPGTQSVNSAATIPPANGPVKLTYWAWLKDFQKVADIWNAQNRGIQVEVVWIPGGNSGGYQKLYSALAAGGGPDLAQVELRSIPEFLLVNGLVDLSRYGAQDHAHLYDKTLWNQVSYAGGVYGIPQDSGPMALFYQPAVLEAAGGALPRSWDDWAGIGKELRAKDVYIDCFPISDASPFASCAAQAGAVWLRPETDGWVINMTDEATLNTARFFDRAIDDDIVNTAYGAFSPAWFAAAAKGNIASTVTGSWGDALIEGVSGASGKWRVAPMPTWGGDGYGSSYLGGSTAAVLANSKHPKEALEFAVWLTTSKEGIDAEIKNSGIGWSPNPEFIGTDRQKPSAFFGGQRYNEEVFVPATRQQNTEWSWWPVTQQSFNILSDGFREKAFGTSLVDSVVAAEQQIITVFKNKGLTIRKEAA